MRVNCDKSYSLYSVYHIIIDGLFSFVYVFTVFTYYYVIKLTIVNLIRPSIAEPNIIGFRIYIGHRHLLIDVRVALLIAQNYINLRKLIMHCLLLSIYFLC